jgi:hypothetical protein
MGIYDLHNSGTIAATVQRVTLPSPRGLAITKGLWLTPVYHKTVIGAVAWPPTGRAWARREPAIGAVIKPGQDLNLVFGLERTTDRTGRSNGPVITYTAGGSTYTLTEGFGLIIARDCVIPAT